MLPFSFPLLPVVKFRMEPRRIRGNHADNNARIAELHDALGYDPASLPASVEECSKVYPAKSAPDCPGSLQFVNFTYDKIVDENGAAFTHVAPTLVLPPEGGYVSSIA